MELKNTALGFDIPRRRSIAHLHQAMVATNSARERTGNVFAGTSDFAMLVTGNSKVGDKLFKIK